ncbi:N-acetyltransferase family protein [Saccharomonospora sp. NPDC046836]|uniref:GNAT family N-acetyltransferase n=1 Tax=Saccharomonospora sp. NPDC046836 TaxID=3156921 RepID=UPI0033F4439D
MDVSPIEKTASSEQLRAATTADLPEIAEIFAHYVQHSVATFAFEPLTIGEWQQRLAAVIGAGLPFLVAEQDGRVAGYTYCSPWRTLPAYRRTVEDSIYLAPGVRGRGLGGTLLDALLAGCAAAGVQEVIAVIADSGDPSSLQLHRRRGFTEAGRLRRVGYKHDRWLDTVLLQRSLVPSPQTA